MEGGDVGVFGQRHGNAALAEGLLHALEDGVVEALDLLRGGLAAKETLTTACCCTRAEHHRW